MLTEKVRHKILEKVWNKTHNEFNAGEGNPLKSYKKHPNKKFYPNLSAQNYASHEILQELGNELRMKIENLPKNKITGTNLTKQVNKINEKDLEKINQELEAMTKIVQKPTHYLRSTDLMSNAVANMRQYIELKDYLEEE